MSAEGQELAAVAKEAAAFVDQFNSLLMATVSASGQPQLSYAPYARGPRGGFCILVSDLAAHTANLLRSGQVEVLFIEAESEARNPFARRRLSLRCQVQELERTSATYAECLAELQARFGETVTLLRGLADFRLLSLQPQQGRYVVGFGRAYEVAVEAGRFTAAGPIAPGRGN